VPGGHDARTCRRRSRERRRATRERELDEPLALVEGVRRGRESDEREARDAARLRGVATSNVLPNATLAGAAVICGRTAPLPSDAKR
jgi:hypothetical protein